MRRRTWAIATFIACAIACGEHISTDAEPSPLDAGVDGASSGTVVNEAAVPYVPDAACDPKFDDYASCLCPREGAIQPCWQGAHDDASACHDPGHQTCVKDGENALRWSTCSGGTEPGAAETCYDAVDNDCNGKVDDTCPCTDVDLCKMTDGGTFAGNTVFLVPPRPKANVVFDGFLVSKTNLGSAIDVKDSSGTCFGQNASKACPSAGIHCDGWYAVRFVFKVTAGGMRTWRFYPANSPMCGNTNELASITFTADP